MGAMALQITSLAIVYMVYSGEDQRKHQSSASLAFVRGIHRWPVNSRHKGPVTRKMFPFDDVIMMIEIQLAYPCVENVGVWKMLRQVGASKCWIDGIAALIRVWLIWTHCIRLRWDTWWSMGAWSLFFMPMSNMQTKMTAWVVVCCISLLL